MPKLIRHLFSMKLQMLAYFYMSIKRNADVALTTTGGNIEGNKAIYRLHLQFSALCTYYRCFVLAPCWRAVLTPGPDLGQISVSSPWIDPWCLACICGTVLSSSPGHDWIGTRWDKYVTCRALYQVTFLAAWMVSGHASIQLICSV
jgi:hypothetical protein